MVKKNLEMSGLEALTGSFKPQSDRKSESTSAPEKPSSASPAGEGPEAPDEPRRGRPKGSVKSSVPRRAVSCKMQEVHYLKLGVMAEMAGCSRQDLMDVAYERLIASFEKENGKINTDSSRPFGRFMVKF